MTTILAYRDTLYADSRCVEDGVMFDSPKLFRVGDDIVGYCGETRMGAAFLEQALEGRPLKRPKARDEDEDVDFAALVLRSNGELWHFNQYFAGDPVHGTYHAIGSGAQAALGALRMMKRLPTTPDVATCIHIAAEVDPYTAPPVQWMKLGDYVLHRLA